MRDLVLWEPGQTLICVLCGNERGGAHPPGPWFRHRPSCTRRIPIYGDGQSILGWFGYVHP